MAATGYSMNSHRGPGRMQKSPADQVHGFNVHLIVYLLVNIGLTVLNFRNNPDNLWFYWVALGWGVGIVFHAYRVFFLKEELRGVPGPNNPRVGIDN